jgi:hypothetical protein
LDPNADVARQPAVKRINIELALARYQASVFAMDAEMGELLLIPTLEPDYLPDFLGIKYDAGTRFQLRSGPAMNIHVDVAEWVKKAWQKRPGREQHCNHSNA